MTYTDTVITTNEVKKEPMPLQSNHLRYLLGKIKYTDSILVNGNAFIKLIRLAILAITYLNYLKWVISALRVAMPLTRTLK